MAHFAKVNNGIVEKVIVAEAEFFDTFPLGNTAFRYSRNINTDIHIVRIIVILVDIDLVADLLVWVEFIR